MYAIFAGRGLGRGGWNDFHMTRINIDSAMAEVTDLERQPLYEWWQVVNLDTRRKVTAAKKINGEWVRDPSKKQAAAAKNKARGW
jgi:hypothetical protein